MQCIHFILLQGFIIFHREITFSIGPDESFGRSISLHRAPPRPQTEAGTGAAQTIIIQVAPPRLQPRQRHAHSAGYYISNAPAESRSAGCRARRKAVRLSGRRHGVAPWASVKLPLRPAFPSRARACPWWSTSWAKVRQAQAYPEASQPGPRPRSPSKARVLPA